MKKRLVLLLVTLLAVVSLVLAASKTWTGTVSDNHCGLKHSTPSAEAAACVTRCVEGGAKFVLVSGGKVYQVEPQEKFKDFAGKSVKVTGSLKGDAITVESVEAAK